MGRRRDLPALPAWTWLISFQSIVPARNRYRAYTLTLAQTLFGEWVVVRRWGHIGRRQRELVMVFARKEDADTVVEQVARRRLLHGYVVVEAA